MPLTLLLVLFLLGALGVLGTRKRQHHYVLLAFPLKLLLTEVKTHDISNLLRRQGKILHFQFIFDNAKLLSCLDQASY